jgi:hypothetical protein
MGFRLGKLRDAWMVSLLAWPRPFSPQGFNAWRLALSFCCESALAKRIEALNPGYIWLSLCISSGETTAKS